MFHEYFKKIKVSLMNMVTSRLFPVQILVIVLGAVLIYRLFYLQIMNGDVYYDKYMQQTKLTLSEPATRGNIYDCNGKLLAYNEITYSVTIKDLEVYTGKGELNSMIYRLVQILNRYDAPVNTEIPVILDESGKYEYSGKEAKIRQFIQDVYSVKGIEKLQEKGEDPFSYDAETVIAYMRDNLYKFENMNGKNGLANYEEISKADALKIMNIRYAMTANAYKKYVSTVVSKNVSSQVQAAILENQQEMQGVEIEEDTIRVYPYAEYFSHVLGYTGKASEEELKELQAQDSSYEYGDVIGKTGTGIEAAMELELSGTKGSYTIYKDRLGIVLDVVDEVEPVAGNDVYLSLDADLTEAVYHMIEEQLAGILYSKIILEDFTPTVTTLDFYICVRDIYFQMINNNILSFRHFEEADASETEKAIYAKYSSYYSGVRKAILQELSSGTPQPVNQLAEEMQEYMRYIYTMLCDDGVIVKSNIDTSSAAYAGWQEGSVSLRDYLTACIENQWMDISKLDSSGKYASTAEVQEKLIEYIGQEMETDSGFAKELYDYLIHEKIVTGNEICIALFDQKVLEYNEADVARLMDQDETTAMDFMKEKVYNLEITPAMIALDPCSGAAVVTDVKTGAIKAMVSYPGYDLNKLSGTVDAEYYNKLSHDLSSPLYSRVTQTRLSPGSTYKMLTGIAGVMENVIGIDDLIVCDGIFEPTNQMCWIFREYGRVHGPMNLRSGLANSCNDYFFDIGYRLSLNENGEYDEQLGLSRLAKYASLFGFDSKTGLEIRENVSSISDEYPVSSAIGQGTNNFTVVQLSRYGSAIASRGNLYEYTLLDKITDYQGNVIQNVTPDVISKIDLPEELWDAIWDGMRRVLTEGSAAGTYDDLGINVAAKTGTAQENRLRGDHAHFLSFAPVEDPEIEVQVMLPNAYTSTNALHVAKMVYQYYFNLEYMEDIIDGKANESANIRIND